MILQACIAIPVGLGEEEPFSDEKLTFIEVGKSTKEDIAAAMSQPMQFLDGNTWLYARTRKEGRWIVSSLVPIPGTRHIPGGITGDVDLRYLVIRFDNSGVVAGHETSSSEGGVGCNRSGVCSLPGHTFMLVATEEEDRAVRQFDQHGDHCGIYVFASRINGAMIRLDDRQIGEIFGNKYFIFEKINPGSHQLHSDQASHEPIEFTCVAGRSVFFETKNRKCGIFEDYCDRNQVEVAQTDTSVGRQAIAERDWLVAIND